MAAFAKKMGLLLLLTAAMVIGIGWLALWGGLPFRDGAMVICEAKRDGVRHAAVQYVPGRTNVLFMGNSKVLAGLKPKLFDELSGGKTSTWNLALPALPIGFQYYQLREYLKNNPRPEVVVLQLNPFLLPPSPLLSRYGLAGTSGFGEVLSISRSQSDTSLLWNYLFPIRVYGVKFLERAKDAALHPERLAVIESSNRAIVNKMFEDRGYYLIRDPNVPDAVLSDDYVFDQRAAWVPVDKSQGFEAEINADPFVKKFMDLAASAHIRVLLVQMPDPERHVTDVTGWDHVYAALKQQYPETVFSIKDGWRAKPYPHRLFADYTHLNDAGADRCTREVYAEYLEVFGKSADAPDATPATPATELQH